MKYVWCQEPDIKAFELLIEQMLQVLRTEAREQPEHYKKLLGNRLEGKVADVLRKCAVGTPFEDDIELVSGQRFPDIVIQGYFGIEVKTTQANHWKSTGSSVAEGTRVNGVERIYMLFGKMCEPVEFKCRLYEECLPEVVVTHSPRYAIDMNLLSGETIFDKMGISYDELRRQTTPIRTILSYYRSKLKPGEELWWLDSESASSGTGMVIRLWNNLTPEERNVYMIKGFCFFPELLSSHKDKFNRFAVWLSTREGVVCPNVRDVFSAGGQGSIIYRSVRYERVPKSVCRLYEHLPLIKQFILSADETEWIDFWGNDVKGKGRIACWIDRVTGYVGKQLENGFPMQESLREVLSSD